MKIVYQNPKEDDFLIENIEAGRCTVSFFENPRTVQRGDDGVTEYEYDVYQMPCRYYPLLGIDIAANKSAWLEQAKRLDEQRNPVDEYQMRADIDYLMITAQVANPYGISTMSLEAQSDPDTLEKARRYYPLRWDKDRLRYLVLLQKLTEEDFQEITGEKYSA